MPSTYTENLFLQKPATGEQAGIWGDTVNMNYDFLDDAIDGNLEIALNAAPLTYTLDTQQDMPSEGRNKVIFFTGALTQVVTIQISPDTVKKLYLVTNNTTGGQALIFQQGTGGTFTLQNGFSAMIYSDGAGAAAKVDGALYNPQFGSLSVANGIDTTAIVRTTGNAGWPASGIGVITFYEPSSSSTLPNTGFIQCLDAASSPQVFYPLHVDGDPLYLNGNGAKVGIGLLSNPPTHALEVAGDIYASTAIRIGGVNPLYFEDYGGGWYMTDAQWIRSYSGKNIWTDGVVGCQTGLAVGVGGALPPVGGALFSGSVGIGTSFVVDPLTIAGPLGNQIRMVYGNYGVFLRHDGTNFFVMVTPFGDTHGGWDSPFPLQINLAAKNVGIYGPANMNYALNVGGDVNVTNGGTFRVNGVPFMSSSTGLVFYLPSVPAPGVAVLPTPLANGQCVLCFDTNHFFRIYYRHTDGQLYHDGIQMYPIAG